MRIVREAELRKNTRTILDDTVDDHDITIVARKDGKHAVLLPLREYNSWMETLFLLRSEKNRSRLTEAIVRVERGEFACGDFIE
jgi:antitoxin YefM